MKSLLLTFSLPFSLALFYGQLSFGQSSSTELQPKGANSESKSLPAKDAIAKTPNAAASMPGAAGNGTALSGKKLNARPAKTGTAKPQGGAISRTVGATTPTAKTAATQRTTLWNRYFQAGELAAKKQDKDLSQRYFIGALTALEQQTSGPRPKALGRLERGLMARIPSGLVPGWWQ